MKPGVGTWLRLWGTGWGSLGTGLPAGVYTARLCKRGVKPCGARDRRGGRERHKPRAQRLPHEVTTVGCTLTHALSDTPGAHSHANTQMHTCVHAHAYRAHVCTPVQTRAHAYTCLQSRMCTRELTGAYALTCAVFTHTHTHTRPWVHARSC